MTKMIKEKNSNYISCYKTVSLLYENYSKVLILTSKYGLHADKTTLCAFRNFPSAASVQSTSVPFSRSVSKTAISVD